MVVAMPEPDRAVLVRRDRIVKALSAIVPGEGVIASEAAMRRVGRSGTGWLGVEGLQDEVTDHLWSIARLAAQDAGRDPDALKTAMRINVEPGTSVDSLAGKLERFAGSGIDEAFVDAFAAFPSLDQMLDFASQVIARWSDRGKA